ncbi:MAG: Geranylgeranyl reductase family protein [Candidatus Syntrophoarchaeum sp. GoM_oil]|nr:MAG: Geranylgeranyl reductase family protein [Candidatus Syntrophoarchaeum sp. GoM_oil]
MSEDVTIIGAGLSGLVSAILLSRKGYCVQVYEKSKGVGGGNFPSIHTFELDVDEDLSKLGIDIKESLSKVRTSMFFSKDDITKVDLYNVERGNRETSIDSKLTKIAMDEGVQISYNSPLQAVKADKPVVKGEKISSDNVIIACGLLTDLWNELRIPHEIINVRTGTCMEDDVTANLFFGDFAPKGYGYFSSLNGIGTPLILTRRNLPDENWKRFLDYIKELGFCQGDVKADKNPTRVHLPLNARFNEGNFIFAGSFSGAIDCYMGFGIKGAMVSGQIAALAVQDFEAARKKFRRNVARKFVVSKVLKKVDYASSVGEWGIRKIRKHYPKKILRIFTPNF